MLTAHRARLGLLLALALLPLACAPAPAAPPATTAAAPTGGGRPRLALWLAKKPELLSAPNARYDLVMTGWVEPAEAEALQARDSEVKLLAGLTHTWVLDDPGWLGLLTTVANGGDAQGPLQVTDDMVLARDGARCTLPGWPGIYAVDPRHPGWRQLIVSFYETVAAQPQHAGVVVDMVDAYPFCDGASSPGVPEPLDAETWAAAQAELLGLIRAKVPAGKWVLANAGRDWPAGSPFPQHVNGYLLENFLGEWGLDLAGGIASAERALETTQPPHIVIFAADTDDTGSVDWARFRTGLVASLLLDNTYFAFDYGSRDHGGVAGWWFAQYYDLDLGAPLGPYTLAGGVYRRDFQRGTVVAADRAAAEVSFGEPRLDVASGERGSAFTVAAGDARIYLAE